MSSPEAEGVPVAQWVGEGVSCAVPDAQAVPVPVPLPPADCVPTTPVPLAEALASAVPLPVRCRTQEPELATATMRLVTVNLRVVITTRSQACTGSQAIAGRCTGPGAGPCQWACN